MPLLELQKSKREDLWKILQKTDYDISLMDREPLRDNDITFQRFICKYHPAQICGCIMEPSNKPNTVVIHIGLDLRRLWKFWQIPKDWKLTNRIKQSLLEFGATVVEDND